MSSENTIRVNEGVLALAVEKKIRPLAEAGVFSDPANEGYHHSKVLPNAQPYLTEEAIRSDPTGSLMNAVLASENLLSVQERIWTKQLAEHCDAEGCMGHLLELLYGAGSLGDRVAKFHDWAYVREVPDTAYKQGCTTTVISYLLAMVDPRNHAFCKPTVYKAAARALLGPSGVVRDKLERVIHASAFYAEVLRLLRDVHELPFDDLLYVHAAFYRLVPKNNLDSANWENFSEGVVAIVPDTPPGVAGPDQIAGDGIGRLLLDRKNVILYGPPGSGKTFKAHQLSRMWRKSQGDSTVEQVTFHPSYAYEDFIEGYRPGNDGFELKQGIFARICERARDNRDKQFLLVIDEINRGDVARLFGELITLIEADKRRADVAAKLPYSQSQFWVPPNLHLLGTMNTADRSISLMDIAIRRRFSFVEFPPDPDAVSAEGHRREVSGVLLGDLMQGINSRLLSAGVDRDRAIGHSYFMIPSDTESPLDALGERMRYDVFPLIEEYCYADRKLIQKILGGLVTEQGEFDPQVLDDEASLVAALTKLAAPE
jgi:AAA domain (dynein-related subfamily)